MRVYISALVGVTGQTLLAGFVDAFKMPLSETKSLLESIGSSLAPCNVGFSKYTDGLRLDVTYEKVPGVTALQLRDAVEKACMQLELGVGKEFALKSIDALIDAESRLHGVDKESLIMHDLGNPETVVYTVGLAYIYEKAKIHDADVLVSEIEIGNGRTHFDNQFYYVPTPVVKEFLNGLKWRFSKSGEMVDALGACLLKNIVKRQEDFAFFNGRVGIGYSPKSFEGVTGRTRVVIGQ